MDKPEVVGEEIIREHGHYKRIRRWIKGKHPKLGIIIWGYTGWETVQELDVVYAIGTFRVY